MGSPLCLATVMRHTDQATDSKSFYFVVVATATASPDTYLYFPVRVVVSGYLVIGFIM